MHPMLNIAIRAATKAGELIIKKSEDLTDITVQDKGKNNFVTNVDIQAEKEILYHLQKAYPDHAILSEESGHMGNKDSDHLWVIDPLDGTNNFIHGVPHYCVSIALEVKGRTEVAVIYNPNINHLFTAARGDGAQLNGKRIRVSNRKNLTGAIFSAPVNNNKKVFKDSYYSLLEKLKEDISGFRYSGSLALDLAYVGAGYYDAAWTMSSQKWDIAAASLIIKEAGGLISEINGGIDYQNTGRVIAGSPKVVSKIIQQFTPHLV
jgi:myo-inositol-1(or 4)-monophosphatase